MFWLAERLKSNNSSTPVYSMWCRFGRIRLPILSNGHVVLEELMDYKGGVTSKGFRDNIRAYNCMFAFTSIGGRIDRTVNSQPGPYIF